MIMTRIMNLKTGLSVIIVLSLLLGASVIEAARVQLPEGKTVTLRFAPGIKVTSGVYSKGDSIPVVLDQPIDIGGKIVVESGAKGTAVVVEAEKAGKGGKPGKIKVAFVSLQPKGSFTLAQGDAIKLTGETELYQGKGKKLLSYLFIFGLFIKGGQGEVPTDVPYEAKVAETVILQSE